MLSKAFLNSIASPGVLVDGNYTKTGFIYLYMDYFWILFSLPIFGAICLDALINHGLEKNWHKK